MAFKTINQYNEAKYGGLFRLVEDGDSAEVIFLYRDVNDVLIGDMHYIKSADYSGYVHCCGRGCPACERGIRVQSKLFIPVYNLTDNEIQFWDRDNTFERQLKADIFSKYPNPCDFVFRVTRHGEWRDRNTRYEIQAIGKNSQETYDQILAKFNVKMPDHYENIAKELDVATLSSMLANTNSTYKPSESELPDYSVTPRASASSMVPPVYESIPTDTEAVTAGNSDMLPDDSDSDDIIGDDVKF